MAGNREYADDELLTAALGRVGAWLEMSGDRHARANDIRILFRVVSNLKRRLATYEVSHFERAEELLKMAEAGLSEQYARSVPPKLLLQAAMCHAILAPVGPAEDVAETTNKFDDMFKSWKENQ